MRSPTSLRAMINASSCRHWRLATSCCTDREGVWRSLGIYADEVVVGHVMWGEDDDGSVWIGGLVVDASAQGLGIGRVATQTLIRWFSDEHGYRVIRLSYQPENLSAAKLYESLGFRPTGERRTTRSSPSSGSSP